MQVSVDAHSARELHKIIQDAAHAIEKARRQDPTALQEISDSTNNDPFRVLIATILSHRTKDHVTALASSRLFAKYPRPTQLAQADLKVVFRVFRCLVERVANSLQSDLSPFSKVAAEMCD